ncbi:Gfo/Idh/MocA family protein [Glutamicibacter sp. NPDC087344]|uniref:Gfo/Idh/MocA family protein n=1 Tax=Glutamicibacter sp. NPDC087344 TaxID=3363994 RepID=UPI0037F229DE
MRIGLVGYGFGGSHFHLPYIQAADCWEIAGIVTRSAPRREQLGAEYPQLPVFDSLDELIDAGAQVVVISTPPQTRRELVLRALQRGVHVVADKPLAADAATARELAAAAQTAGKVLTVYQNRRWDTDFLTLKQVADSGELGQIFRAHLVMDQADPGTLDFDPTGGLLRDLGTHLVDQAVQLLGPVARVDAALDWLTRDGISVDVGFSLGLHHENGTYSQVSASKLCGREARLMDLYASGGSYSSAMSDRQIEQMLAGQRPSATPGTWGEVEREDHGVLRTGTGERTVQPVPGNYTEYYRQLFAALQGRGQLPVRLDEALHTIDILDAARNSDRLGRSVALGE